MKRLIIFLLLIILGIMGYNLYRKYQRFHPPNYEYKIPETISKDHSNKAMLLDYYQAIEDLNGHVITQWSTNGIDVRNPKKDNARTKAAVSEFNRKKGIVKFYESQLTIPANKKPKPKNSISKDDERKKLIRKLFSSNPESTLVIGEDSALVYEMQQLLIENGYLIRHDGIFRIETFNALKAFEKDNDLFPDGELDIMTLEYLLR